MILLLILLLTACQTAPVAMPANTPTPSPAVTIVPSATADLATLAATPSFPVTPAIAPTEPPPTPAATTEAEAITYTSDAGHFSLLLPPQTAVYENYRPTVDGLFSEAPQSVSLIRESPNYALSVTWTAVDVGTTLDDFVSSQSTCASVPGDGGEPVMINGVEALLFDNAACGPFYTAIVYLLGGNTGYVITIDSMTPYRFIADFVQEQLESFSILNVETWR